MVEYAHRDRVRLHGDSWQTRRPLSLSEATLMAAQITNITRPSQIQWAVIGGAAVALLLDAIGHPAAWSRTSSDFDVAASDLPKDKRLQWGAPLVAGGRVAWLGQRRIDWLVRHDARDPVRALQGRLIASAQPDKYGIMIPPADAVCALKICLSEKAFRPKDFVDCRLLLSSKLASPEGIRRWLSQSLSCRTTKEQAQRNLNRVSDFLVTVAA